MGKLTARQVETITKPGRYSDGAGLYLRVREGGSKQWTTLWVKIVTTADGKRRRQTTELSLGRADASGKNGLSLAAARDKAVEIRQLRQAGLDPKAERRKTSAIPTFAETATNYIEAHGPSFRNAKHLAQWRMTLETYCKPIRVMTVDQIDTDAVLRVLKPIWHKIPETASRLRGRIERVLASAIAAGHRSGPNPAIWRGHLDTLLGKRQKLSRGHHAALPYSDMAEFMIDLRDRDSTAAQALEFLILTAARSNEVLGAKWKEIDWGSQTWHVPKDRMKAGVAHRVPLSPHAIAVLNAIPKGGPDSYIFPGQRANRPLSVMAMTMQLRRMGRADTTVHGMRSSIRDWAAEQTSFPHTTAEHALAHRISDKAEAAYRRGDELERRRELMAAWGAWCFPAAATNVITLAR